MYARHLKRGAVLAALAAVSVTGITSVAAAASSDHAARGGGKDKTATITMFAKAKKMGFEGPKSVKAGSQLRIVNDTDPEQVGPHTFTLVKKAELPTSKQQIKDCEKVKSELCEDVVKAHKADPKTGQVGKPDVDVGKKGWDKSFGKKGDTWFTEQQGESTKRKVSAKPGTTLYYFCAVHPFMQGKIKVK